MRWTVFSRVAISDRALGGIGRGFSPRPSVGQSVGRSVCPESVLWKTAEWIYVPFGVVHGVGRGTRVLDGVVIVEGTGVVLGRGEFGASHCNQWGFAA